MSPPASLCSDSLADRSTALLACWCHTCPLISGASQVSQCSSSAATTSCDFQKSKRTLEDQTHTLIGFVGQDSWLFLGPTQCVAAGFWLYSGRWQSIKHVTQRVIRAGSLFSQQPWGAAHLTAKTSVIYNGFQGRNNTLTNLKERTRN